MKTTLYGANTRGYANHGWLESYHSFSFANYHNPERVNFGVLRVLNDDRLISGMGFGKHPHDNMEIVSIPLSGDLEHQDSMGNITVIKAGDVQVMSAGTGISHSEKNKNRDGEVKFLQIWIQPNKRGVQPRYDQITLNPADLDNKLAQILSPNKDDDGVWVYQDAWFHMGNLNAGTKLTYSLKKEGNGVYAFVLNGNMTVAEVSLNSRDAVGITETSELNVIANTDATVLLMEVPMR